MEGEKRKRKIDINDDEEESEEEQMEKFNALIKSTKDLRDRLSKQKEEEKAKGVWNPTFQPEDFIDDDEVLKKINVLQNPPAGSSSEKHNKKETAEKESSEAIAQNEDKKNATDNLDLKLSL